MIIYGTRSAHLNSIQSHIAVCPNCETKGSTLISIYRRHTHIFWIPIFPLGKSGASHCKHCKVSLRSNEMSEPLKREYQKVKQEAKGPVWQFSGLFLAAALIVMAGFASKNNKASELSYLENPTKNDVYEYKIGPKQYSTMKVMQISKDSVFVSLNDFEISKSTRIYKIDKPENYPNILYGYSKQEISTMYHSGKIFDINRR